MPWRTEPGPQGEALRRGGAFAGLLLLAGCGGGVHGLVDDTPVKIGRPYMVAGRTYVPTDDQNYDQIGLASWYGNNEQGRHTANGETFYRQRVSAAHTTLPLPSYVEVTRLDTGRRILVRVNDRGPYARDRILDLSEEAARELGMQQAGTAMVRVRRVTPSRHDEKQLRRGYPVVLSSVAPSANPLRIGTDERRATARAPRPVPMQAPALRRGRYIVVATPTDPDAADAVATALASEQARSVATGRGYRVITGPYPDDPALMAALARLRADGYQGATVVDAPIPQEPNGTTLP